MPVTGPTWLADSLAALMLATALYCISHLIASWVHGRAAEPDVDLMHVAMGVATAGMLVVAFDQRWNSGWEIFFAACAAWFAVRGVRAALLPDVPSRSRHHAQHVLTCATMTYMLAGPSVPAAATSGSMPGMHHGPNVGAASQPSIVGLGLTVVLLCYAGWQIPHLVAAERLTAPRGAATMMLAPRVAVGCSIAVSATMSYLLLTG